VDSQYLIFIVGDMPHIVKKFVNALKSSGDADNLSTDLIFDGQRMTLGMLKGIWEDINARSNNSIHFHYLSQDHFPPKNANTRMRVHLAAQITSQTMIGLIERFDNGSCDSIKKLLGAVDRFINIMNATTMSNHGVHKDAHVLNHPYHAHIPELFKIASLFGEWKK
jgi:hypothetical protein